MALIRCKECGGDVSDAAEKCMKCGALTPRMVRAAWTKAVVAVIPALFILALFGVCADLSETPTPEPNRGTFSEGETVEVGHMAYAVWGSWWSDRTSDVPVLNQPPNARYLFVELTARNDDRQARDIPSFNLVDGQGTTYSTSVVTVEDGISFWESLNPGVSKQGVVVFDVPPDRTYWLKLSGGFWSSEYAHVRLTPGA